MLSSCLRAAKVSPKVPLCDTQPALRYSIQVHVPDILQMDAGGAKLKR